MSVPNPKADEQGALKEFKSVHVIARFWLRMIVLCVFAALGSNGFQPTMIVLLLLSAAVCVVTALFRREKPFDVALTYWDEAAVYVLLCGLIAALGQSAA